MNKPIPFFSLERQYKKNKKIITKAINSVLETQKFIGGDFVQEFEKKFSAYVNARFTISCNSGTDALWMALKALNIAKNSIVLTTPFSFIASCSEISAHEAHPVFIDIDPKTFNIDPEKLELWLKENTFRGESGEPLVEKQTGFPIVGIITVDLFGQCADYNRINQIAAHWGLWVIEDACQAVGTADNEGKKAGTFGKISCFSFYPTKNLGAFGDAGCCTTDDPELAEKLLQLRNHGRKTHYDYIGQGINSRLDGIQAAILSTKLDLLDQFNIKRQRIAKYYNRKLSKIKFLQLPNKFSGNHTFHQYCIKIKDGFNISRERFMQELKDLGVNTNVYYPKALNEIDFLNKEQKLLNPCPISKNLSQTIFALPIWPELKTDEVKFICECIKTVAAKYENSINITKKQNRSIEL